MKIFPLAISSSSLELKDFSRFNAVFSAVVLKTLPTSKKVELYSCLEAIAEANHLSTLNEFLSEEQFRKTLVDRKVIFYDQYVVYFFPVLERDSLLLVVSGIEPAVCSRFGNDWLQSTYGNLSETFGLLKQARIDEESGALNSVSLRSILSQNLSQDECTLFLLDVSPRQRRTVSIFQHVSQAAAILDDFLGDEFPLHHLGQNIFSFVVTAESSVKLAKLGGKIVAYLRKEGFLRVHVSCGTSTVSDGNATVDEIMKELFNQAWTALHEASKRGPYAFCDYEVLTHPEKHPLKKFLLKKNGKLLSYLKKQHQFCLVQFKRRGEVTVEQLYEYLETIGLSKLFLLDGLLFYVPVEWDKSEIVGEVKRFLEEYTDNKNGFDAGISYYPHSQFSIKEQVFNSHKALLHAEFFEPGSVVEFDRVSLNISGDVYYAEGDIAAAIKEYRLGLELNQVDVNLLNSLGVAYIMLGHHSKGQNCFERVLKVDPDNHMALYNLGLEFERKEQLGEATGFFRSALRCYSEKENLDLNRYDLEFHLGMLLTVTGGYTEAIGIFERILSYCDHLNVYVGKLYRYLGKAYYFTGQKKEAAKYLQLALNQNKFDAEALSFLGIIYFDLGQGAQIALSLCEKSLDLNPNDIEAVLHLGAVQVGNGEYKKGFTNLKKCLKHKRVKERAAEQLIKYYAITAG